MPSGTLSTAEAISVLNNGLAMAAYFGDGRLSASDLAGGLTGAVVKDATRRTPSPGRSTWRRSVKEREGWKDLYRACRETPLILGIRHHGPGSARSVLAALDEAASPTVLLDRRTGGDASALVPHLLEVDATGGDALFYDVPTGPGTPSTIPFAEFSPGVPGDPVGGSRTECRVRFIDLPASARLAMRVDREGNATRTRWGGLPKRRASRTSRTGGSTSWSTGGDTTALFEGLEALMEELRKEAPQGEDPTLQLARLPKERADPDLSPQPSLPERIIGRGGAGIPALLVSERRGLRAPARGRDAAGTSPSPGRTPPSSAARGTRPPFARRPSTEGRSSRRSRSRRPSSPGPTTASPVRLGLRRGRRARPPSTTCCGRRRRRRSRGDGSWKWRG